MVEQNLSLNPPATSSLQILNPVNLSLVEKYLTIPAIYSPNMSNENWERQLDGMLYRTFLTRDFLQGKISFEDYMDGIADSGLDSNHVEEIWEEESLSDSFYLH